MALGEWFSSTEVHHVYSSDLLRAFDTAKALHSRLMSEPKPPFEKSPVFREQHFGVAEGQPWVVKIPVGQTREDLFKQGIYPVLEGPTEKFENGESTDDMSLRAERAMKDYVLPHIDAQKDRVGGGETDKHIVVVSHGWAIARMISSLTAMDPEAHLDKKTSYRGLLNTAWARVQILVRVRFRHGPGSNYPRLLTYHSLRGFHFPGSGTQCGWQYQLGATPTTASHRYPFQSK